MQTSIKNCKKWLEIGLQVVATIEGKNIKGVIGEINEYSFYIWQNSFNGASGSLNPKNYGFSCSWVIDFRDKGYIKNSGKILNLKHRELIVPHKAIVTGYETYNYEDKHSAISIGGKKCKEKIYINDSIIKTVFIPAVRSDRAKVYLMGGKDNIVTILNQLPSGGGCWDTPSARPEVIANMMTAYIAQGQTVLGFLFARYQSKRHYRFDSLVNNMLTWSKLFPKCYVVLLTQTAKYAWNIENQKIQKITLQVTHNKPNEKDSNK